MTLFIRKQIDSLLEKQKAIFAMPGHKGILSADDITELEGFDDLNNPKDCILSAEKECAKAYNTHEAFFLVNGSTSGIVSMQLLLFSILKRPPKILVGADCHKSFASGAYLAGSIISFVNLPDESFGVVYAADIEARLENEFFDAVFITYPNYYGMCCDIRAIHEATKKHGTYLCVDAAHGAHFAFLSGTDVPVNAVENCDMCVVSAHKTLCSLNQAAILFSNDSRFTRTEIQNAVSMVQTTSPSYPIVMSIENGVNSAKNLPLHQKRLESFERKLKEAKISTIETPLSARYRDRTRLCISCKGLANSGFALGKELLKYGIHVEMSDALCVVLITSPIDSDNSYDMLFSALMEIKAKSSLCKEISSFNGKYAHVEEAINVRESAKYTPACVELESSVGMCPKNALGIYPPGIAVVFPNETITKDALNYLLAANKMGGTLFGGESINDKYYINAYRKD